MQTFVSFYFHYVIFFAYYLFLKSTFVNFGFMSTKALKQEIDIDKIRTEINERILSMSEIARQMRVSKTQLSKFLNGQIENDAMVLRCTNWLGKTTNDYKK